MFLIPDNAVKVCFSWYVREIETGGEEAEDSGGLAEVWAKDRGPKNSSPHEYQPQPAAKDLNGRGSGETLFEQRWCCRLALRCRHRRSTLWSEVARARDRFQGELPGKDTEDDTQARPPTSGRRPMNKQTIRYRTEE